MVEGLLVELDSCDCFSSSCPLSLFSPSCHMFQSLMSYDMRFHVLLVCSLQQCVLARGCSQLGHTSMTPTVLSFTFIFFCVVYTRVGASKVRG